MALFYRLKKLSVLLKAVIGLVLVAGLGFAYLLAQSPTRTRSLAGGINSPAASCNDNLEGAFACNRPGGISAVFQCKNGDWNKVEECGDGQRCSIGEYGGNGWSCVDNNPPPQDPPSSSGGNPPPGNVPQACQSGTSLCSGGSCNYPVPCDDVKFKECYQRLHDEGCGSFDLPRNDDCSALAFTIAKDAGVPFCKYGKRAQQANCQTALAVYQASCTGTSSDTSTTTSTVSQDASNATNGIGGEGIPGGSASCNACSAQCDAVFTLFPELSILPGSRSICLNRCTGQCL